MPIKEQLYTIVDLMREDDVKEILDYVKTTFIVRQKTWDDIPEVEPLDDEMDIIAEYQRGKLTT